MRVRLELGQALSGDPQLLSQIIDLISHGTDEIVTDEVSPWFAVAKGTECSALVLNDRIFSIVDIDPKHVCHDTPSFRFSH